MLSSSRTLSVALTRIADQPTLVLDSAERLERAVGRHDAGKTSALDIYRAMTAAKEEPKIERKELQKEMTRERSIDKEIGARERRIGILECRIHNDSGHLIDCGIYLSFERMLPCLQSPTHSLIALPR
jgi:hypothetical protein